MCIRDRFVAGYHDGKLTVLRVREDGSIGEITDEIFHKGLGSIAERNFRPHINCARMTHDNKYLLVADQGMDHVNVYRLDLQRGKLAMADVIRSELESAPRHIKISRDGRFIYILHEWKCYIDVYLYQEKGKNPYFEKIQSIPTMNLDHANNSAASALSFSTAVSYTHLQEKESLPVIFGTFHSVFYQIIKQSRPRSAETLLKDSEKKQWMIPILIPVSYTHLIG